MNNFLTHTLEPRTVGLGVLRAISMLAIGGLGLIALLVAGLMPVFLPWFFVSALCFGVVYLLVLWRWPLPGIAVYLCIVFVSPDLKISDVVTVFVIGVLTVRQFFVAPNFVMRGHPLVKPFAVFMLFGVLSTFLAIVLFRNQISFIYRDGRVFAYWLWLPLLIWMVQNKQLTRIGIQRLFAFFAIVVAVAAIAQAMSGIQFIATGRVADLEGSTGLMAGVTRVQLPGYIFVAFASIWLTALLAEKFSRFWLVSPILLVFVAALYVNFGRALWAWTAFSLILTVVFLNKRQGLRLAVIFLIGSAVSVLALYAIKPEVIENVVERMTSVQREGGRGSSYGWRKWENADAAQRIQSAPLLGVAVGGEYRRWIAALSRFEDHTRYVHNSYLFFALKIGVPGLLALLWLVVTVWWRAFLQGRSASSEEDSVFCTAVAAYIPGMLGMAFTQPDLAGPFGALFIAFVAGALQWERSTPRLKSLAVGA